MEGQSCSEAPYFAWAVLAAEREIEMSSGLWTALLRELFMSPAIQQEQALKVSCFNFISHDLIWLSI